MVAIIKKGSNLKKIRRALKSVDKGKNAFNPEKYCGVIKLKGDALLIQKKLRNEWE